jgi:hypothetical protein
VVGSDERKSSAAFAGQLEPMPCKLPPTSCCVPERQPRLLIMCLFCQLIAMRGVREPELSLTHPATGKKKATSLVGP